MTPPPTVDELRERARAKLTGGELRALTTELRRQLREEMTHPPKQPRVREAPEIAGAARRMIRAVGDRAAQDVEALPLLAGLRDAVDEALQRAVDGARDPQQHAHPYSWADVGRVLGLSRQGAQQRFERRRDVT